jgi:hypothetical protein
VAGVAGDFALAIEDGTVERECHLDHVECGFFLSLVVGIEMSDLMTVTATNPERDRDVFHGGVNIGGGDVLEHLHVLIELPGGLTLHRGSRRVGRGGLDSAGPTAELGLAAAAKATVLPRPGLTDSSRN